MESVDQEMQALEAFVKRLEFLVSQKELVAKELESTYGQMKDEINMRKQAKYGNTSGIFIVSALALACVVVGLKWIIN
ncbi:hypothetical protein SS50377_26563 [Spironucleus salmonicida]|uniref:Uncharacterized protein n=1 Tax=Spironucleus salmonicida TaxID=348837 RepID=V6LAH8_9EUKA|nr:hypothetical protein SS50377_26563 [Spironucleus salmonicida]|eukprot:EST41417.1 Hypothetical protein SS50377_19134 [Spironucleus salmonicida]